MIKTADSLEQFAQDVRLQLRIHLGDGAEAWAGTDDDLRGYHDDGFTPEACAQELISYLVD